MSTATHPTLLPHTTSTLVCPPQSSQEQPISPHPGMPIHKLDTTQVRASQASDPAAQHMVNMPLPADTAADYIAHQIEQYFFARGRDIEAETEAEISAKAEATTGASSSSSGSSSRSNRSMKTFKKLLHINGVRVDRAIAFYIRTFNIAARNNPYNLPARIYMFVLFGLFFGMLGTWAGGAYESWALMKQHDSLWFMPMIRANLNMTTYLLGFTLFLHPALLSNVKEVMQAYGYSL